MALQIGLLQNRRGEFLNRARRGVEDGYAFLPHQLVGLAQFVLAIVQARVSAARAAFAANALQAFGPDSQAEKFAAQVANRRWQGLGVEVLGNQRIVGCANAELQRHIQASGSLAAAGDPNQDHVGIGEILGDLAVIVCQGEVHRFDAAEILVAANAVRPAHRVRGMYTQFFFHRLDENLETIDVKSVGSLDRAADGQVHQRAEDQRTGAVLLRGLINLPNRVDGLLRRIDERKRNFAERDLIELGEQAVPEHLGGDPGAVGDEECGTFEWHCCDALATDQPVK